MRLSEYASFASARNAPPPIASTRMRYSPLNFTHFGRLEFRWSEGRNCGTTACGCAEGRACCAKLAAVNELRRNRRQTDLMSNRCIQTSTSAYAYTRTKMVD